MAVHRRRPLGAVSPEKLLRFDPEHRTAARAARRQEI
jgi:hypothetical protein